MNDYYFKFLEEMRIAYQEWDGSPQSPYYFDSGAFCPMTPIERNMWGDIRAHGLPMYYQFPIGPYYADFADPFHGLVVEVDGKIHEELKDRDARRDGYIRSVGFDVLRIPGRETYDKEEEDGSLTCEGYEKVLGWYTDKGFELPVHWGYLQVPWRLFRDWKKSIGVSEDKRAYDRSVRKRFLIKEILSKKMFYTIGDHYEAEQQAEDLLNKN